ncbi:MAG: RNA polymerase sigma factor [Fimbriiglobus sp.]|jgi:RNA polymerase sigma factor (sigma-70 family)|nr:RNA polymerase sigma factor [Fimbriiglobus sp.]
MTTLSLGGLFGRLRPPADAGSDADLLRRFVQTHEAEAFAEIARRHGAMVLAVCRRVLGNMPDAEDAHQVAFMALARDAGKIADPNALGGWLYRVAWLSARKLAGRVHRCKPEPLTTDPAVMMPPPIENDMRAVIDEELLALPARFRSVAVLCLVEGRTNTEAAGLLGIPKGTVDSRLSTAKQKLRERLIRRGIAAAALLAVENLLTSETAAASTRAAVLATSVITVALDYAAGVPTVGAEHLLHTANGVRPMANNLKWLVVLAFSTTVVGGGGVGMYVAAQEKKPAEAKKAADEKKLPAEDEKPEAKAVSLKTADDVQKVLKAEVSISGDGLKLGDVFDRLEAEHGLNIRLDTASFRRRGWGEGDAEYEDLQQGIYSRPIRATGLKRVPIEDALRELLAQVRGGSSEGQMHLLSYRIKGNSILIVPEYKPATIPNSGQNGEPGQQLVTPGQLLEDMYGEPVTVRYKNKPLAEVVEDLQERTGANIVLNAKALPDVDKTTVTANFNDVRLLTALKIVGDMHGLKPVVIDNVFYLTDAARAEKLQAEVNRDLFGTPPAPPVNK